MHEKLKYRRVLHTHLLTWAERNDLDKNALLTIAKDFIAMVGVEPWGSISPSKCLNRSTTTQLAINSSRRRKIVPLPQEDGHKSQKAESRLGLVSSSAIQWLAALSELETHLRDNPSFKILHQSCQKVWFLYILVCSGT